MKRLTPAMREYLRVIAKVGDERTIRQIAVAAERTPGSTMRAILHLADGGYLRAKKLERGGHVYSMTTKGKREVEAA